MPTTRNPQTSSDHILKIAQLAKLTVSDAESAELATAFDETLEVVNHLRQAEVGEITPTHQVTGLENVWREDEVTEEQSLTQQEALANAARTHQGFIVVPPILEHKNNS